MSQTSKLLDNRSGLEDSGGDIVCIVIMCGVKPALVSLKEPHGVL